ncbi:hypothetical protein GQR58_021321 [Nymphon striatum]|nr:hypothetical protein GQR58_021321 [Nymphon striatum]
MAADSETSFFIIIKNLYFFFIHIFMTIFGPVSALFGIFRAFYVPPTCCQIFNRNTMILKFMRIFFSILKKKKKFFLNFFEESVLKFISIASPKIKMLIIFPSMRSNRRISGYFYLCQDNSCSFRRYLGVLRCPEETPRRRSHLQKHPMTWLSNCSCFIFLLFLIFQLVPTGACEFDLKMDSNLKIKLTSSAELADLHRYRNELRVPLLGFCRVCCRLASINLTLLLSKIRSNERVFMTRYYSLSSKLKSIKTI